MRKWNKRALACVALTVVCVAIILLTYLSQTPKQVRAAQESKQQLSTDSSALPVLPLLWLLLPLAAVAAYFIERLASRSNSAIKAEYRSRPIFYRMYLETFEAFFLELGFQ